MREENIEKMNFKELRNEVQYLRDELAMFKRKFNDIIYNLDSDNFGKSFVVAQDNMKAQIKINAQEIATKVSTEDFNSEITQTADKIRSVVAKSSFENEAVEVSDTSDFSDIDKIYVIREYVSGTNYIESETYYFYSGTEWEALKGTDLYTCFEQSYSGFKLKGDVSVDGNVVASSLQGKTITGSYIYGATFYGVENNTGAQLKILPYDFSLYAVSSGSVSITPYYNVRRDMHGNNIVNFDAAGYNFLEVTDTTYLGNSVADVSPKGYWNFSGCDYIYWGNNAPSSVAVFG